MLYENIIQTIGKTPVVKIHGFDEENRGTVYAKLEFFNPGGSAKDRIGAYIIEKMEKSGVLKKGDTLVEPTSGNTGIGMAMVCACRGYNSIFVMPESMSMERKRILQAYGAKIVLTPADKGMQGSIEKAEELAGKPHHIMLRQFENPDNPEAHYFTTAEEIIEDFKDLDNLVAGVGTGGTLSGVSKRLKEVYNLTSIAVEPLNSAVLSGKKAGAHTLMGIGAGFIPKTTDMNMIDRIIPVSDEDAIDTARNCAVTNGILLGFSGGAALFAALETAKLNKNSTTLCIIPDNGERYLSTKLYEF